MKLSNKFALMSYMQLLTFIFVQNYKSNNILHVWNGRMRVITKISNFHFFAIFSILPIMHFYLVKFSVTISGNEISKNAFSKYHWEHIGLLYVKEMPETKLCTILHTKLIQTKNEQHTRHHHSVSD